MFCLCKKYVVEFFLSDLYISFAKKNMEHELKIICVCGTLT